MLGIKAFHLWTAGCSKAVLVVNHVTGIRVATPSPVLNVWRVVDLHENLRASPLLAESVFHPNTNECVQFQLNYLSWFCCSVLDTVRNVFRVGKNIEALSEP